MVEAGIFFTELHTISGGWWMVLIAGKWGTPRFRLGYKNWIFICKILKYRIDWINWLDWIGFMAALVLFIEIWVYFEISKVTCYHKTALRTWTIQCSVVVLPVVGAECGVTLVHQQSGTLVLLSSVAQEELKHARISRQYRLLSWGKADMINSNVFLIDVTFRR